MAQKTKPAKLRILEGNRGHRPILENPEPKRVYMRCPQGMGKEGKKIWKRYYPVLFDLGLLTEADVLAFKRYCELYDLKTTATSVSAVISIVREMRMHEIEFGMTPSSRSKLSVKSEDKGEFSDFIKKTV